jgi:EmrB/QacA subfamily drug resistance transporter
MTDDLPASAAPPSAAPGAAVPPVTASRAAVPSVTAPGAADSGRRRWLILGVIGVAQLMVVLDATIVNIALPSAQRALGFSTADRQWVITAYALAFGGLLLVGGRLSDLFGRKRTFIVGLAGFAAASAAGGAAPGLAALLAARAAQGAFGALLAPSALALLGTTFTDPRERGRALGIFTAIAGGGGAIGLLLGGVLTEYLSWRWCLYVNVAFAGAALIGAITLMTSPPRSRAAALDVPGGLLSAGGLAGLVFGFSEASTRGWGSGLTVGLLAGGAVLLAAFAVVERRMTGPLVPLSIITDRVRGAAYLGAAVATFGVLGTFLLGTYYLQGVLGFTPLVAGLAFLPFLGGVAIAANVVSNVGLARLGPKVVVPAGLLVAAAGAGWLTRISTHGSYAAVVVPGFVLLGLGAGAAVATAFSLGPAGARPADAGVAAALVNASNQVGGSIGAALLNTIAASVTAAYLAGHAAGQDPLAATVHGDVAAFTFLVALFAAGAVTTGLLYPRKASVAVRRPSSGGAISPTPSASAG